MRLATCGAEGAGGCSSSFTWTRQQQQQQAIRELVSHLLSLSLGQVATPHSRPLNAPTTTTNLMAASHGVVRGRCGARHRPQMLQLLATLVLLTLSALAVVDARELSNVGNALTATTTLLPAASVTVTLGESTSSTAPPAATSTSEVARDAGTGAVSADDAVNDALKTAPPTVAPTVAPTAAPWLPGATAEAPAATPVVTPAPVVTTAAPDRTQVPAETMEAPSLKTPKPSTPAPSARSASSSTSGGSEAKDSSSTSTTTTTTKSGSMSTDGLATDVSVRSGQLNESFDSFLVLGILGGVGAIAAVIGIISRNIYKQTGGESSLREQSTLSRL